MALYIWKMRNLLGKDHLLCCRHIWAQSLSDQCCSTKFLPLQGNKAFQSMAVSIATKFHVTGGSQQQGKSWVVQETVSKEGQAFVPLTGKDSGLSRFICGKCKMHEYTFLNKLKQMRNKASAKVLMEQGTEETLFQAAEVSKYREKILRQQAKSKAAGLHAILEIELPGIQHAG